MIEYILIAIFAFALFVLLAKYFKVKYQIKNVKRQLENSETRHHTISVELFDRDIDSLTLAINHLIEENNKILIEAEKINHYLKSSIADISHDMRTPLTSAIGYLQLLNRSNLDDKQRQYLSISIEKSQYLRKLISDFFELSALNANDTVCDFNKIDLAGIASETILDNAADFTLKGITPIFETSDNPVFILGDFGMLQRVIQNIISNCLKYSCGDVIFTINENDTVKLTIENQVANIKQIDVERVFDRFYKADSSRSEQGTGLGLSIAQLLVEKMGGSISAYLNDDSIVIQLDFPKVNE